MKPAVSLDLYIDHVGADVRISARGSRDERIEPFTLSLNYDRVMRFAADVQKAAEYHQPLQNKLLEEAHTLHRAVLDGPVGMLLATLREAAGVSVLLRLMVSRDLQSVPWEALCQPGTALGFWGTSSKILPVRGVASAEPGRPREVRGPLKVLVIAPLGDAMVKRLRYALADREQAGQVQWLDPIVGVAAQIRHLPEQLRTRTTPDVVHYIGDGGMVDGVSAVRLADEDDKPRWLPAEVFAQHLHNGFSSTQRLVILEACEGARSNAFASAAETLAQAGADAVVAQLWPVAADVARTCSTEFYRAWIASGGDVGVALNAARLLVLSEHDRSAEAFSPVAYVRGPEGRMVEFDPRPPVPAQSIEPQPDLSVRRALEEALMDAFRSEEDLVRMVRHGLDRNLGAFVGLGRPLSAIVFDLVEAAEAGGFLEALVRAARAANAGNTKLRDVALRLRV